MNLFSEVFCLQLKCCGGASYTDYLTSVWSENELYRQYRENKAPATCCSDYWKFKDTPKSEYNNYNAYCSIYLIDGDISGNPLLDRLNHKLFKTVKCFSFYIPTFICTHAHLLTPPSSM